MYRVITPLGTWLADYPTEDAARAAVERNVKRWRGLYRAEDFRVIIIDCPSVSIWLQDSGKKF